MTLLQALQETTAAVAAGSGGGEGPGTALGILVGLATLAVSVMAYRRAKESVSVARRALDVSENQLGIARDQAEQRPDLRVTQVDVVGGDDRVKDKIRAVELAREYKESMEKLGPLARSQWRSQRQEMRNAEAFRKAEGYDGPLPDFGIRLLLANRGRAAASEITGWLYFDPAHLSPLEFFSDFDDSTYIVGGDKSPDRYRVKVGGDGDQTLFPSPTHVPRDYLDFTVYVSIKPEDLPVVTKIGYEFVNPTGASVQGKHELTVAEDYRGFARR